jgi:DNA transposition AAA+ family ATPase
MEHSIKKEIVAALKEYMSVHGMKPADVATKAGVNPGYLSLILKEDSNFMYEAGSTKGFINSKHFYALAELCGYKVAKEYWQLQPTPQMNAVLSHLQKAKEASETLTIIGETGCGKSYSTELFASKNPLDTFIVVAGSNDTLKDLLSKTCDALKVNEAPNSKAGKIRAISAKLRSLTYAGFKPMLIIDEAEFLNRPALCAIKEVHDYIKDFCSIVLIGTDQLVNNIDKLKKKNQAGIPQFHRRIKMGLRILPNINSQFALFIDEIEDRELKKFLLRNCNNYGELHDVLVPSLREADKLQCPLSMDLVRKVINLPVGDLLW